MRVCCIDLGCIVPILVLTPQACQAESIKIRPSLLEIKHAKKVEVLSADAFLQELLQRDRRNVMRHGHIKYISECDLPCWAIF